ncbi:hypothetical protein Ate02nite_09000 [Paractinoplanes tereljensis]|uniref:Bulb-type lectin domain-containing protein n=2 Tax=Paractinoplanes tereljensis TaxID=571912 RepID=A0A919TR95_9ACTN|nr:hypothetical protein Ate02nite_09000 [Actinoplanes tereljensis]
MRYLWRPRHSRDDDSPAINWIGIALGAAIILGLGALVFAVFRTDDDSPATPVTLPTLSVAVPGDYPSAPVSLLPSPAPSPSFPPVVVRTAQPPSPAAKSKAAPPVWEEKVIASTSTLTTGQSWSTNRLSLTVTAGGNLVLTDQGRTVWQTGTTTGVKLVMQNDGHLVLYDAANAGVFSSHTENNPGAVLILRADGNMVIALNGRTLFQTRTGD